MWKGLLVSLRKSMIYIDQILEKWDLSQKGCCALEFGECQPQCRNRPHKLIQLSLMLLSDYPTHVVKTKKGKL